MGNKKVIVNFANKQKNNFQGKTPTEAFSIFTKNEHYKVLIEMWDERDVIIFCFLITTPIKDLSVAYDIISNGMYGYQVVNLIEESPKDDCDYCEGSGHHSCDECSGRGEESCDYCDDGDIECDDCDGDGTDEEGDDCSSCEGTGKQRCDNCDGRGYVDCQNCQDGDVDCNECDGTGEVTKDDFMRIEYKQIITYNPSIKNKFLELDDYLKIDSDLYENTSSDIYNLVLKVDNEITQDFESYNEGQFLLVQLIDNQALHFSKNRYNKIWSNSFNSY